MDFSRIQKVLLCTAVATALGACSSSNNPDPDTDQSVTFNLENAQKVLATNADIALAAYNDSVTTAEALQTALTTFESSPTQENLDAAKIAWLVAREPYGQTEVTRFRLSPIDSSDYSSDDGLEGSINAWPLGEALIDYVTNGSDFGVDQTDVTAHSTGVNFPTENIINSNVVINAALLENTASAADEHDVIAGYHAIEFMLWGQDLNLDTSADTEANREQSTSGDILNSGGHRPLTDFTADQYADRRFQFMNAVADKLVAELKEVRDGWKTDASYRTAFTTITNETEAKQKFAEILTGMGTLSEGELAGERMQIAFSANSQEDEHSCFSDNTHRDIWLDAEGVSNSYYGTYAGYDSTLDGTDDQTAQAVNGYGFDDYLSDAGATTLAAKLVTAFDKTEIGYIDIDREARVLGNPVDVLIMDVNRNAENPIAQTIIALNEQSAVIAELAVALGIDGNVVDDDASGCDTSNPQSSCDE